MKPFPAEVSVTRGVIYSTIVPSRINTISPQYPLDFTAFLRETSDVLRHCIEYNYFHPSDFRPGTVEVHAIMSASLLGNRDLPASQYNLNTYWGRVRQSAEIADPR